MTRHIISRISRYSLACSLLSLALASCVKEPPKRFDQSATERMQIASDELSTTLRSSEHGWILNYYPEFQQRYGGYVVAMKFIDPQHVQIISESPTAESGSADWVRSDYQIKQDKGITLSFDTYNAALHLFSDPDKNQGRGVGKNFEGDYEFTLDRPMTADTIYLRGRKTGNKMQLVRAKADAKEYLTQVQTLKSKAYTAETMYRLHLYGLEGTLGKKQVLAYLSEEGYNTMSIEDQETGKRTEAPFICTPTGIRFFKPYEGITELTWDDASKTYSSDLGDKLAGRVDPDYEGFAKYLGAYTMNCEEWQAPKEVTFVQHARNIYAIQGLANGLTILADYDAANKRFEIKTQQVLTGATTVYLCVWAFRSSGNLSWLEGAGMYSKLDPTDETGKRYLLVDNGAWGDKTTSFILWVRNQGRYQGFGGLSDFKIPTFTKH